MGIPDHLTCFLRNLYAGQEATVRTRHGTTDWFQIEKGVWKQPRCSSADEWIRKLWYIHTIGYYSVIKEKTFESALMRWMKLEPIIQIEVSQEEKH